MRLHLVLRLKKYLELTLLYRQVKLQENMKESIRIRQYFNLKHIVKKNTSNFKNNMFKLQ